MGNITVSSKCLSKCEILSLDSAIGVMGIRCCMILSDLEGFTHGFDIKG